MFCTELKFVHIGMGNIVCANKIIAMIRPNTTCGRKHLKAAKANGTYIDACLNRPLKTILLMEDNGVIGSAITAKTLMKRCNGAEESNVREEDLDEETVEDLSDEMMEEIDEGN